MDSSQQYLSALKNARAPKKPSTTADKVRVDAVLVDVIAYVYLMGGMGCAPSNQVTITTTTDSLVSNMLMVLSMMYHGI